MSDKQMLIAGARFASIVLSCISAIASLVVLVSYTRTVLRIRAHHRQIIEDSKPQAPVLQPRGHCFSCESIATPCMSQPFYPMPARPSITRENPFMQPIYKPDQQPSQRVSDDVSYEWSISSDKKHKVRRRINLPCPVEYYNRMAANMSLERLALPSMNKRRERLSRKPSSKIALLSAMDLLLHLFWVINTLTTTCHVTLFFFTTSLLLYMFLLAFFALTSLLRLRNMQNSPANNYTRSRRADLAIYLGMAVAAGLLSLLPVVMGQAKYDSELQTCWLATGPQAMRWVWMSLNSWVVLALLFLIAASAYIGVLLTNERRSLLSSLRPHTHHTEIPPSMQQVPAGYPSHAIPPPRISSSSCSHCYISSISDSALRMGHGYPQPQSARSAGPRVPMPQQLSSQHLSNKHMSLPVTSFSHVRQGSISGSRLDDSFRKPTASTALAAAADDSHKPAANSMPRSTGQLQRIEQRIHVLIATGALRVGMRAMVPLLTQLPLVAWSSSYTVQPHTHLLYIVAILLLSIQGLLDMMLYYIFDTQNDQPTVSLPSHLVQSPAMQPSRRCLSVSRIPSDIYFTSMDQMAHSHHQYHPCPPHSLHPRQLLPHMCYLGPPPPPPSSKRRQNARHSVPVADVTCTPTIRANTATPSIRPNTIHTPSIRPSTTHTPSIRPNAMHMLNGWDESDEHPSTT